MDDLMNRKRDIIQTFVENFNESKKLLLEIRNHINEFSLLIDGCPAEFRSSSNNADSEQTAQEDQIIRQLLKMADPNPIAESESNNGPPADKEEKEERTKIRIRKAIRKKRKARYRFSPKKRRRPRVARKLVVIQPPPPFANSNLSISIKSEYDSTEEHISSQQQMTNLFDQCKIEAAEIETTFADETESGYDGIKTEPHASSFYDESEYESLPVVTNDEDDRTVAALQQRPYKQCSICSQYVRDKNLMKHKATLHSANLDVECPVCKASLRKASFAFHMRRQHNNMRHLSCNVCGKVCSYYWILIHMYKEHELTGNL